MSEKLKSVITCDLDGKIETLSEGAVKPGATGDIVRQAWAGAIERMQSLEFADLP